MPQFILNELNRNPSRLADNIVQLSVNPIPNFTLGELSKDQYRAISDVNQVIYDGGISSAKKDVENINLQVNIKSVDCIDWR